jgi:hypothetical protein
MQRDKRIPQNGRAEYARMNVRKFHAPFSMASLRFLPFTTSPFSAFALDFSCDDDNSDGAACLLLLRLASPICRHHTRSLIVTTIVRGDVLLLLPLLRWVALYEFWREWMRGGIFHLCVWDGGSGGYDVQYIYVRPFANDDIFIKHRDTMCDTPR